ncbi:uncharacterized protein LOC122534202 isoform X1 [Frieseomelitta varia]|uniref:uncharacterized protein LOC122534202 isoform X1 n=1 Tax=Frieseomelitta varia TaxID=561572 RepID=UPI001CB6B0E8|nr:uncharacterized protein LOC122534202 isoform X1 [Frieseomelitta varia]
MANIFNLFGETSELHKEPVTKPLARSKSSLDISGTSLKNVSRSKPKGLSIRSNSDLNVSVTPQNIPNKQQELLKPTQVDNNGQVISPRKAALSKKSFGCCDKLKDISPKKRFNTKNIKLPVSHDESIFKRPLPLKNNKKLYPEPESLAPYCDMQFKFDDVYTKGIENEFEGLLEKEKNEDEGFESGSELIDFEMPELRIPFELFDEREIQYKIPDLPEISNDDKI